MALDAVALDLAVAHLLEGGVQLLVGAAAHHHGGAAAAQALGGRKADPGEGGDGLLKRTRQGCNWRGMLILPNSLRR